MTISSSRSRRRAAGLEPEGVQVRDRRSHENPNVGGPGAAADLVAVRVDDLRVRDVDAGTGDRDTVDGAHGVEHGRVDTGGRGAEPPKDSETVSMPRTCTSVPA